MLFEVNFDEYSMHSVAANRPTTSFSTTRSPRTPNFEIKLPKISLQIDSTLNADQCLRRVPSAPILSEHSSTSPSLLSAKQSSGLHSMQSLSNHKRYRSSSESLSTTVTQRLFQVTTNLFHNASVSFLNLNHLNL